MTGRQRIGVVVSTAWLLLLSAYAFYESYAVGMPLFTTYSSVPHIAHAKARDTYFIEIDRTSIDIPRDFQLYEMEKRAATDEERQKIKAERIKIHDVSYFAMLNTSFVAALFFPILAFWTIAFTSISAWNWVAAGFLQAGTKRDPHRSK
jgi:hypothetical protein